MRPRCHQSLFKHIVCFDFPGKLSLIACSKIDLPLSDNDGIWADSTILFHDFIQGPFRARQFEAQQKRHRDMISVTCIIGNKINGPLHRESCCCSNRKYYGPWRGVIVSMNNLLQMAGVLKLGNERQRETWKLICALVVLLSSSTVAYLQNCTFWLSIHPNIHVVVSPTKIPQRKIAIWFGVIIWPTRLFPRAMLHC